MSMSTLPPLAENRARRAGSTAENRTTVGSARR